MKKSLQTLLIIFLITIFIFLLSVFDLKMITNSYVLTLWNNLEAVLAIVYVIVPLLFLMMLIIMICTNRLSLNVYQINIGGLSLLLNSPINVYKNEVRNFLNSKRTLFCIDLQYDNFNDVIGSYFEIYQFFKKELSLLQINKSNKKSKATYDLTNNAIAELNRFLTVHQSNYRRWYKYIELTDKKRYYLVPISILQKEYPNYDELLEGFKRINAYFINNIVQPFNIDIKKWH